MPRYFFDIKDGHRLVDPAGRECKDDKAAIEMARVLAIGVSLDTPAIDPSRVTTFSSENTQAASSVKPILSVT